MKSTSWLWREIDSILRYGLECEDACFLVLKRAYRVRGRAVESKGDDSFKRERDWLRFAGLNLDSSSILRAEIESDDKVEIVKRRRQKRYSGKRRKIAGSRFGRWIHFSVDRRFTFTANSLSLSLSFFFFSSQVYQQEKERSSQQHDLFNTPKQKFDDLDQRESDKVATDLSSYHWSDKALDRNRQKFGN